MKIIDYVRYGAKALFAGVVVFLGALAPLLVGDASIGAVTQGQWVAIALATIIAVGGVFGLTNAPKPE